MITSAKQEVRYTPRDFCDEDGKPLDGAPVYIIEPPTVFTRSEWNRDLLNIGARQVSNDDLLATLRRGIREVVEEDQRAELLAFVQAFEDSSQGVEQEVADAKAVVDEHGEESPEGQAATQHLLAVLERHNDLSARMEDLEGQMRQMFPPYARKLSDQVFWMENAPIIASQRFIKGGENVEIRRERGRLPDDVLNAIPRAHLREVGWHIVRLMFPSKDDAKNSARPTSAANSRKPSGRVRKGRGTSGASK